MQVPSVPLLNTENLLMVAPMQDLVPNQLTSRPAFLLKKVWFMCSEPHVPVTVAGLVVTIYPLTVANCRKLFPSLVFSSCKAVHSYRDSVVLRAGPNLQPHCQ